MGKEIKERLPEIKCSILIFKSLEDHVVPPYNQDYIYNHVGSTQKELVELKNNYHVATLDNDWELIVEKTQDFIQAIVKE